MNSKLLFFMLGYLMCLNHAQSQCIDTLPANTVVITSDTVINNAQGMNTYLICPGVEVNYTGVQSTFNNYYLTDSASLLINSYHYPQLYMQSTSLVNANHSTNPPPSYLMSPTAEYGATFLDTIGSYVDSITWCSTLVYDYSNLPGGVGCPVSSSPCVEILPANTIVITSDTVITNAQGMVNYLICPGVDVVYNGGQSTFVNYYLETGASLDIGDYHYPQVYLQSNAELIANHSTASLPSYLMNPTGELGAIFTDTLDPHTGNVTWCTNLVFDYSNLPGGMGCPTMTNLDQIKDKTLVNIYPNPAQDYMMVAFNKNVSNYQIILTNSLGQTIYHQTIHGNLHKINRSNTMEQGVYFLSVLDENNAIISIKKMILK